MAADRTDVGKSAEDSAAPAPRDVVEIVDRLSGARVTAVVTGVKDGHYVLRLELGVAVPDEAQVRWYDGDQAWVATSQLVRIDETSASFELGPAQGWKPAPVRRSLRAPVGNSPMLVKVVSSTILPEGHSVHAVCLDISTSGCRAKWTGVPPLAGDAVTVAWDVGDWHAEAEPGWVAARVARVVGLPFGGSQVAFTFETADAAQGVRVRAWHQAWLQAHRQSVLDRRAS
jgi:hypothetical protein